MPKVLQLDEQGNILAVADLPWTPNEGATVVHDDDHPLLADLHKVKFDHATGRIVMRPKAERDEVDSERAKGKDKGIEARLAALEKRVAALEGGQPNG